MRTNSLVVASATASLLLSCTNTMNRPFPASSSPTNPEAAAPSPLRAAGLRAITVAPVARRTGFATARHGARIYYEVSGSGPAMVFVHGLGGNHAVWFQQVSQFAANHTVVVMSQRGFAPSGGTQDRYNVDLLVSDLTAVMDAAGVKRAVVIGQSMGGWTALGMALQHPQRVDALVLADTVAGISNEAIASHMKMVTESAAQLRNVPPPLGVHPALSAEFSLRRPDLACLYQMLSTFGSPPPGTIAAQLAAARVAPSNLKQMKVPTLFIVGSEDRLFPPPLIRQAAGYISGAQVAEIPQAGHSPYYEIPEAWYTVVADFMAALESTP